MKTLVLGIGNTILGDDGVGVLTVQELAGRIKDADIDLRSVSFDGLNLLELMLGYDRLIVVDAILTENGKVGEIYRLKPEQVCKPSNSSISPHHFNLVTTLAIGKKLFPDEMPSEVTVFAVSTEDTTVVTEEMTDKVRDAIPRVASLVSEELRAV